MAISEKNRKLHLQINQAWWEKEGKQSAERHGGFLEEQRKMTGVQYGVHHSFLSKLFLQGRALTGKENICEVVGVYNVLQALHSERNLPFNQGRIKEQTDAEQISFPELVAYFEGHGIWLRGYFGTFPTAMGKFLKRHGYFVKSLWGFGLTREKVGKLQKEGAFLLVTMNNKRNLWDMIHTMCISIEENGYRIHNDFEGANLYPTLEEAVYGYRDGKGKPLLLYQICTSQEE